jgi:hypothetical protein
MHTPSRALPLGIPMDVHCTRALKPLANLLSLWPDRSHQQRMRPSSRCPPHDPGRGRRIYPADYGQLQRRCGCRS